jgi:hypothetical protein
LSHWPSMKSPRLAYMKGLLEFLVKVVVRCLRHPPMRALSPIVVGSVRWPGGVADFRAGFIPSSTGLADGRYGR